MLEQLFWFILFPFVLAFVLGFMSYGLVEIPDSQQTKSAEASESST